LESAVIAFAFVSHEAVRVCGVTSSPGDIVSGGGKMNKSNEWWTQAKYIEAARTVLGGIDLDPASCESANLTVKAAKYYTIQDDGLKHPWHGCVWLNPPYSRDNVARGMEGGDKPKSLMQTWIEKLIAEYRCGNVPAAILLTKADPKENWFQPLWDFPICFARDRVYFNRPGGSPEKMMFGTAFVYLGPCEERFIEVFSRFGRIVRAIDPSPVVARELWQEVSV
jgi:DNA N-6-adenine-methyltransferase (Dam)